MTAMEKVAQSFGRSAKWAEAVPGHMEHFYGFIGDGIANCAPLEPKMMQLLILAVGVANGSEACIYQHTSMIIDAGGTREEFVAGLNAVIMAAGGLAWGSAGFALEVFDELVEAKK